jgi:nucleoside-diphosphate-sugar epimerase
MKALVTGAPGWLGTRLVEVLLSKGNGVRCIALPGINGASLSELGAQVLEGDITDPKSLQGVCDRADIVFHCAGLIHPRRIKDLYSVNVAGTDNILREAVRAGVKRFVYVSSNSVGGTNSSKNRLMSEIDPPRPYMHYGLSKYRAEKLVNGAFKEGKIQTTIIRPCWFYGIRQPERQTTFFKMIKKGNPIVFGDGSNLRSMSYIDNIVEALLLTASKDISIGKTYWIADEKPYPTIEIYKTIAELLGVKEFKPRFLPSFASTIFQAADAVIQGCGMYIKEIHVAGEMDKDIACSIEKARKELGYEPKIGLVEGMRRSIEWCRSSGIDI